jgi:hypothetical protein
MKTPLDLRGRPGAIGASAATSSISVLPMRTPDDDPEYRIAYDVEHKKVGCVLIQAALGCDVPRDLYFNYFDTDTWTLDANACTVYPIRRSQLPLLAARTTALGDE